MNKPWGITDSLRADRRELLRIVSELKRQDSEVATKRKLFSEEFLPLLEGHIYAMEETLSSRALSEPKLRDCANEGLEEHDLSEFEVAKIKIAATDDQWIARVKVLASLLERHLQQEEKEFFPLVEQVLSPEEQSELASRYSEARERQRLAPIIQLPLRTFATEEKTGS